MTIGMIPFRVGATVSAIRREGRGGDCQGSAVTDGLVEGALGTEWLRDKPNSPTPSMSAIDSPAVRPPAGHRCRTIGRSAGGGVTGSRVTRVSPAAAEEA